MTSDKVRRQPSLLVFSDDWGRHPSSCQHLVRQLLPRYRVAWVNTIGMRRPRLDLVSFRRGAEKLRDWMWRRPRGGHEDANPEVLRPLMWPWFASGPDRWVNKHLLARQLAPVVRRMTPPVIGITTLPITVDLIGRLPVTKWVYYCVDDFSKWPGLNRSMIDLLERELARRADAIVTASDKLTERMAEFGREARLLTHGVDVESWNRCAGDSKDPHLQNIEEPIVLFWGSIDWQMDLTFIRRLSEDLDRGTIVLLGPRTDHDPALLKIPRVKWTPAVPYEALPGIASAATVLIMPYLDAPGLRESQPLKLKEYLATSKPAVVRDLPANRVWENALDLAGTAEEFSSLVRLRIQSGLPASHVHARRALEGETWAAKASELEECLDTGAENQPREARV